MASINIERIYLTCLCIFSLVISFQVLTMESHTDSDEDLADYMTVWEQLRWCCTATTNFLGYNFANEQRAVMASDEPATIYAWQIHPTNFPKNTLTWSEPLKKVWQTNYKISRVRYRTTIAFKFICLPTVSNQLTPPPMSVSANGTILVWCKTHPGPNLEDAELERKL